MKAKTTIAVLIMSTVFTVSAYAQTSSRTTPVEVKNAVTIDQTGNTVKSQQNGTWSVGVTGTPSVNVTNVPSVNVINTPSVSVTNTPTVMIDDKYNTVKAPAQSSTVQLWTGIQLIASNGVLSSNDINCKGYKEARFFIYVGLCTADLTKALVGVRFTSPSGNAVNFAKASFATSAAPLLNQSNVLTATRACFFTVPVMSDTMSIYISNLDVNQLSIDGSRSWVYLVN